MLSERDYIETWPEQGIIFEPVKLDIRLPSRLIDSKKLQMAGLASVVALLTAGCTANQHEAFEFSLGGFVVNAGLTYANFAVWSEKGQMNHRRAAIAAAVVGGIGCINRGVAVSELAILSFIFTGGIVSKINGGGE
jgi:hypothetical protein